MSHRALALLITVIGLVGCGSDAITVCPADLQFGWTPHDTTIAVGEQVTASLSLFGCAGRDRLADTITFRSSDVSVAVVGTTTGVIIGAQPGAAIITASAKYYHVSAMIRVQVK